MSSWKVLIVALVILLFYSFSFADENNTVKIFDQNMIHFAPDSSTKYDTEKVTTEDNGRVITTTVNMPEFKQPAKIMAKVKIHPIPKDAISVCDPWDRAGSIRLSREGMADIEIVKFITAYGGFTEYEVDVSHLAPLLKGACNFKGFIDTWLNPGWKVDFTLIFEQVEQINNPDWIHGLMFIEMYKKKDYGDNWYEITIDIPKNIKRIKMNYFVSGHCTDGTDADEFISKDNVIYIDGIVVYRFKPWRDDCRKFRDINPYTRRWSDGFWSSDYSRSGWCPGDMVVPLELDLTDHLTPGEHTVKFVIEDVRPKNENDQYGYWRISAHLFGFDEM